jgi:hypothetical protein
MAYWKIIVIIVIIIVFLFLLLYSNLEVCTDQTSKDAVKVVKAVKLSP